MEKISKLHFEIRLKVKYVRENIIKIAQKDLANKCNLDATYLLRVENGKQNLTIETLGVICEALGMNTFTIITNSLLDKS